MVLTIGVGESHWLEGVVGAVSAAGPGFAVVEGVLGDAEVRQGVDELESAYREHRRSVGDERLRAAGERGVVRVPMVYRPWFFSFFEIPAVLSVVDRTVGSTAICHLQNGFVNRPDEVVAVPSESFQSTPHRDFPRHMNGYLASVNTFFALSDFTERNGATRVLAGSHQKESGPSRHEFETSSVPICCPAGSMIVFDSTIWHAAGQNLSTGTRYGVNHQWTKAFLKQQVDYVRAIGGGRLEDLPERTRQLLGWYTRVVTSMDEFYRTGDQRLYRAGQG